MKIVTLLSDLLSTWFAPVHYEQIIKGKFILHFYTVTNGKYVYNGQVDTIGTGSDYTKEKAIEHVVKEFYRLDCHEAIIIFDERLSQFVWATKNPKFPQLTPCYDRY